ncbi:MAG: TM2 domain-containing protein [Actinomyces urogenitalis]|nr:TM2 domain-containing protein [Actinomyces urogenitalis]
MTQPLDSQQVPVQQAAAPKKSKNTAALLAFFLGGVGAHSFYLGQHRRAGVHIPLAILSFGLLLVGALNAGAGGNEYGQVINSDAVSTGGAQVMGGQVVLAANSVYSFVELIHILINKDRSLS